jgi:hypothetical protein
MHVNRMASLQPGFKPATAQMHYQSVKPFTATVTALLPVHWTTYMVLWDKVPAHNNTYFHASYQPCLASTGETSSRGWRSAKTVGSWGTFPTVLCTSDTELLETFCGTVSMTRSNMMPNLVLQTLATWTGRANAFKYRLPYTFAAWSSELWHHGLWYDSPSVSDKYIASIFMTKIRQVRKLTYYN